MLVYKTLFTERHGVKLYMIIGWCKYSLLKYTKRNLILHLEFDKYTHLLIYKSEAFNLFLLFLGALILFIVFVLSPICQCSSTVNLINFHCFIIKQGIKHYVATLMESGFNLLCNFHKNNYW